MVFTENSSYRLNEGGIEKKIVLIRYGKVSVVVNKIQ